MTIKTWALSLTLVLAGWIGVQALVMRFTDAAPGAIALFPSDGFGSNLPADMAITGAGSYWIAVQYDGPGLARALYSEGALLVLPAGLPGCLPLPS